MPASMISGRYARKRYIMAVLRDDWDCSELDGVLHALLERVMDGCVASGYADPKGAAVSTGDGLVDLAVIDRLSFDEAFHAVDGTGEHAGVHMRVYGVRGANVGVA